MDRVYLIPGRAAHKDKGLLEGRGGGDGFVVQIIRNKGNIYQSAFYVAIGFVGMVVVEAEVVEVESAGYF